MAAYRAMVEGRNLLLGIDGKVRRCGFYQTVFLQCTDPSEVESIAVRAVKGDIELNQMTRNDLGDPPMLYLDGFEEIDDSEPLPTAKGRSYYVEKRWWQFWK
jgi:hypothetical protein